MILPCQQPPHQEARFFTACCNVRLLGLQDDDCDGTLSLVLADWYSASFHSTECPEQSLQGMQQGQRVYRVLMSLLMTVTHRTLTVGT